MPLTIKQFGGGEGSYAGDCALITADDWACLVDLGRAGKRQNEMPLSELSTKTKLRAMTTVNVVLTHFHADHIADERSWRALQNANLFYFDATESKGELATKVASFFKTAVRLNSWHEIDGITGNMARLEGETRNGLSFRLVIIPPDAKKDKLDENDLSMGVLLEVGFQRSQRLTFLSLGDMTPTSANDSVSDCLRTYGFYEGRPLDLVKLAHHGSEKNLLPVLWDVITPGHTRLIVSGYTMTDTSKLCRLLAETRPKECVFLFETDESMEKFRSTAALSKVLEAGGTLARDYRVTIGDTGDVSMGPGG